MLDTWGRRKSLMRKRERGRYSKSEDDFGYPKRFVRVGSFPLDRKDDDTKGRLLVVSVCLEVFRKRLETCFMRPINWREIWSERDVERQVDYGKIHFFAYRDLPT